MDTPGGEACVLGSTGLGYTLFVPELPQYTLEAFFFTGYGIVAFPLCNDTCAAFLLVSSLFKCCLQLLLVSLCYVYDFFFPSRP